MRKPVHAADFKEAHNWRAHTWAAAESWSRKGPTVSRAGLEALVASACEDFTEGSGGVKLPWNLPTVGAPWFRRQGGRVNLEDLERAARFSGWLRAASKLPEVVRLISRTTRGDRGVNSPRTWVDLWKVAERFPSPQRFNRWIKRVRARAAMILEPWGLLPSWRGLAFAATKGNRRVGRAALSVARHTVGQVGPDLSRMGEPPLADRVYLARARGLKRWLKCTPQEREAASWAVFAGEAENLREGCILALTRLTPHEVEAGTAVSYFGFAGVVNGDVSAYPSWGPMGEFCWLFLREDGRSWHGGRGLARPPDALFRAAREDWLRQDLAAGAPIEEPADRCWLISREDSLRAGNCELGTEQFLQKVGLAGRTFLGVQHLLPYKGIDRVARVLEQVALREVAAS